MSKFQVGDIVRRTFVHNSGRYYGRTERWTLEIGSVCTVLRVGDWYIEVEAPGVPSTAPQSKAYFELVSRAANVRPNDPTTSHVAAANIKVKKVSIKAVILDLLDKHRSGLTGQEIADFSGYRLNSITPRFAELSRKTGTGYMMTLGAIRSSGAVRNGQIVWVLS